MSSVPTSEPRLSPGARAAREAAAREDVHSVTTARKSLAEDQAERTRQYLVSMTIRTVCFVLGVLLPSPWRWLFFVGAVFLPYIAVVMANAVNVAPPGEVEAVDAQALAAGTGPLILPDGSPVADADAPRPTGAWAASADGYVDADVERPEDDVHVGEVVASRLHDPVRDDTTPDDGTGAAEPADEPAAPSSRDPEDHPAA